MKDAPNVSTMMHSSQVGNLFSLNGFLRLELSELFNKYHQLCEISFHLRALVSVTHCLNRVLGVRRGAVCRVWCIDRRVVRHKLHYPTGCLVSDGPSLTSTMVVASVCRSEELEASCIC